MATSDNIKSVPIIITGLLSGDSLVFDGTNWINSLSAFLTTHKEAVRIATTLNGTLATAYSNGQVVDGVVVGTGDRILIKDQSTGSENGIYTANASGAPTRDLDMNTGSLAAGSTVYVTEGTANSDKYFGCTTDSGVDTVGTDPLAFAEISGSMQGAYDTGATVLLTAAKPIALTTSGVGQDGVTVTDGADTVQIKGDRVIAPTYVAEAGTVGAPSKTYVGETDKGEYSPGAGQLGWSIDGADVLKIDGTLNGSSGVEQSFDVTPTINQSGTAGYGALVVDVTETATGSGSKSLLDLKVGGVSQFTVDNAGVVTVGSISTTTGTIGTADGTAGAPSQTFAGETTKGMFSPGAGQLGFVTDGATKLTIDGTVSASSGVEQAFDYTPEINQSGTAGYIVNKIDVTETATGSGDKKYVEYNVGGVPTYSVATSGDVVTSGTIAAADGTTLLPAQTFGSDLTTGIALAGTGILEIATDAKTAATIEGLLSAATGNQVAYEITPEVNKATSGNYTALRVNVTETAAPEDAKENKLLDLAIGGTSKYAVDANGLVTVGASTWKVAVRVATTVNGALATAYENGDTVDTIVLATNDTILLKNQSTGAENGIYVVNATGAPTRRGDLATGFGAAAMVVQVSEGGANANSGWLCTNNPGTDVIGTDAIVYTSTAGAGVPDPLQLSDNAAATPTYSYGSQTDTGSYLNDTTDPTWGLAVEGADAMLVRRLMDHATVDEVAFDLSATVNKAAGSYTGLKLNVVDTLSPGVNNNLFHITVDGNDVVKITDEGALTLAQFAGTGSLDVLDGDVSGGHAQFGSNGYGGYVQLYTTVEGSGAGGGETPGALANIAFLFCRDVEAVTSLWYESDQGHNSMIVGPSGLSDWRHVVRVATTANGALATAYENGDTVDGVVLATGDRILLKDQSTGAENGVYTVEAAGAPTRAEDFLATWKVGGSVIVSVEGTANAGKAWMVTDAIASSTVATDALTITEFGGGAGSGDVTAAASLTDNRLMRGDTTTKGIQDSGISVSDTDALTNVLSVVTGAGTVGTTALAVGAAGTGLYRPAASQLGLAANSEAVIVDNDGVASFRPDVTSTWLLGEEAFAWTDVNANNFSLVTGGSVEFTINTEGIQYTSGMGTFLVGQLTPASGAIATALQFLGGQGGAFSGAAGQVGGAVTIVGGIGGAGDATYACGAGGDLSLSAGNAGSSGAGGGAVGGDLILEPGIDNGEVGNGSILIGQTTIPEEILSPDCDWHHAGKFTYVPAVLDQTGATLTVDDFYDGYEIYCNRSAGVTITVNDAPAGTRMKVINIHASGQTTFVAGTSPTVTINKSPTFTLLSFGENSSMWLTWKTTTEVYLEGDLGVA